MKKILLLGANGQVGHELRRSLAPLGQVVPTTRTGLLPDGADCLGADFDRPDRIGQLIADAAPDIVVNAAAYTAVDRAEDEPEAAFRANAEVPGVLARACADRGATLVHYSTDYVFDGQGQRPYRETDATAPLGVYGASKLAGEQAVTEAGGAHFIFRTAWVYGTHGHNFMKTMLRLAAERDELRVVADQFGTPTPAYLIADATAAVLGRLSGEHTGVYHLTASGKTSWHGFAEAIIAGAFERGMLARRPAVQAIATAQFPTRAQRPAFSCLDSTRLETLLGFKFPLWRSGLGKVLDGTS
ncbi:dTDP-4-dehydrorhamnose reductase [Pseudoxanthomonas wuyuanensis]|uniref:dTDP-4-dehydrorhamnose reductase n=1 Tax=Pseudoxanthomonas wuyuanensis TaxID=1073196 RepID=A0A286DD17_9GAMM|nr:dTDP-4-dehydrorhamnose reductase [Pseudoxanthomonas wuyuanensis]KAF1720732.1 dTDP-4-dehydrorhamnose reductase [Pseudoxanthomonas wuyuanensis]SOD56551.1 dTDP-4-dehydrorhamnose reductase [Pseudoxanthomonas wuyuanensis]